MDGCKNDSDQFLSVATPKSSTRSSIKSNSSRWSNEMQIREGVSRIVDSVFSKVGLPDFGDATPEVSRASTTAFGNHRSTAGGSSYLTDADTSSLGILSVGNLSDFSISDEMPMDNMKRRSESTSTDLHELDEFEELYKQIPYPDIEAATQNFRKMLDEVIGTGPDFSNLSFDSRLKNLYGDKSEEVKEILDCSNITDLDNTSVHSNSSTTDKSFRTAPMGSKAKTSGIVEKRDSSPETPKNDTARFEVSQTQMDTPFTRFMKAAPPSISDESVEDSTVMNPFGDRGSFEVEKFYEGKLRALMDDGNNTNVSSECTNLLNKSDVMFSDEYISARSSSISHAKDSANSSCSTSGVSVLQKTCIRKESSISDDKQDSRCQSDEFAISDATAMALQQNFFESQMFSANDIGENEFFSKEAGLKMIQDDEEKFEQESFYKPGMNDSYVSKHSFWSLSNQPAVIERPSWWSDTNSSISQLHLSQLIAARTETLGSLSEDSERTRPFFGTIVMSPDKRKGTRKVAKSSTNCEGDSFTSKHESKEESRVTDGSTADNSIVSLSTISQIVADISLQDVPSAVTSKFQEKNPQKSVRKCLSKDKRYKTEEKSNASLKKKSRKPSRSSSTASGILEQETGTKHRLQSKDYSCTAPTQQRKTSSAKRYSELAGRCNAGNSSSDEKNALISTTNASPKAVNRSSTKEQSPHKSSSQSALQRSSSFEALGLRSMKHRFDSDSTTSIPQTSLGSVLNGVKSSSDTESSASDTKSQSSFSTVTCSSSRCCQHPHAASCCLTSSTVSAPCPFSATPNLHNNFPFRSSCASNVRNFHEQHLPVCSCIASGVLSLPFASQTVQHLCANDFTSGTPNINLAASFPPPQMYPRSVPSYALPLTMAGSVMPACIQGTREFKFPSTCVGDKQVATLNLHNPTVTPLFYHFHFVSAIQNGSEVPISLTGVSCEPVVQAMALSPVNVQLCYAAQVEGEMTVQLHVSASHSRDATCSLVGLPFVVKLFLHAENPRISISSKGKDKLEFIAVMENSSASGVITLENLCGAPVPLKLVIEEQVDKDHSFSFSVQDRSVSSNTFETQKFSYVSSKVVLCKVGNPSAPFANKLTVPINFTAGKCQNGGKTECVSAMVAAFLGNSTKQVPLATIQMSATVGTVCICLKPPVKDPFLMRAALNCKSSKNLSLLNRGSIPVTADLGIQCEKNSFSVVPPTVHIGPQSEVGITVYFEPSLEESASGILQAAPPNQDKIFDLAKFCGEVLQSFQLSSYQNRPSSRAVLRDSLAGSISNQVTVESNKKCLSWGGVGIGQVIMKTVSVRNPSNTDVFRAKAVISEKCSAYMLVNDANNEQVLSMDLVLKPKMQKQISVVFSPTEKKTYLGHLSLKPELLEKQAYFSIPLCGYGGVSNVKIVNLLEQGDDMCFNLRLTSTYDYEVIFANLVICNVGCRAAFVKILCVKADSMDKFDEERKINIQPSEFILLEQESKTIQVTYSSDADYSFHPNKRIGRILMYFGDEMMRQKMRRCCTADFSIVANNPLKNVNFNVSFAGEENVVLDDSYPDSKRDFSLFYNSLQKITVNAIVTPESSNLSQVTSFSALSLVQDSMYKQGPAVEATASDQALCGSSPPVRDFSVASFRKESTGESDFNSCESRDDLSVGNSSFHSLNSSVTGQNSFHDEIVSTCNDQFSVVPQKLMLDSENRDLRLVIISHSQAEMRFKLTWSVNVICVSPVQGVVPPKGEMGLRVRVLPYFDGKQRDEVIEGFIRIFCGSSDKYVPVKVCLNSLKSKHLNNPMKNFLSVDNVATYSDNLLPKNEKDVKIASTSYTSPNSHSPKSIRAKNVFTDGVPVEKPPGMIDAALNSCNGNSSVLLENNMASSSDSEVSPSSEASDKNSNVSTLSHSRKGSFNVQKSLIVEPETILFPVTKPNEKKTTLVTLKNPGSKSYQVTVEKPHTPFVIKRTSFTAKPNYFVSFQVHFCPKAPGSYHGILSVMADNGFQTKMKMNGSCAS